MDDQIIYVILGWMLFRQSKFPEFDFFLLQCSWKRKECEINAINIWGPVQTYKLIVICKSFCLFYWRGFSGTIASIVSI